MWQVVILELAKMGWNQCWKAKHTTYTFMPLHFHDRFLLKSLWIVHKTCIYYFIIKHLICYYQKSYWSFRLFSTHCADWNHSGVDLENSGKNCYAKCNGQGKCDWCGKGGYCCKKGWHESNPTSHGCDGSFGGVSFHACVLKPKCGLDPSPTGGMYKQCVSDPITGFK